jgi:hypothetical protein
MEINPNHPVTMAVHDHWHKIALLLMLKMGKPRVVITPAEIQQLLYSNIGGITIRTDDEIGIILEIVTPEKAEELARKEGGLPV